MPVWNGEKPRLGGRKRATDGAATSGVVQEKEVGDGLGEAGRAFLFLPHESAR
jgi:hypothetical protein